MTEAGFRYQTNPPAICGIAYDAKFHKILHNALDEGITLPDSISSCPKRRRIRYNCRQYTQEHLDRAIARFTKLVKLKVIK